MNELRVLNQGGVLSPLLFNMIVDDVLKESKSATEKLQTRYRNMQRVELAGVSSLMM